MKKLLLLPLGLLAMAQTHAATDLLAGWDFNNAANGDTADFYASNYGSQKFSARLIVDGSSGSSNLIEPAGPPTFDSGERTIGGSGTAVGGAFLFSDNRDLFTSFSTSANKELQFYTNTDDTNIVSSTLNGKSVVFFFPTYRVAGISVQLSSSRGVDGPNLNTFAWSLDGVSYNSVGGAFAPATTFATFNLDLSAVNAIENQAGVYLKMTFGGQGVADGSTNFVSFDNVQIGGTVVPEPSTWAAIAGVCALGGVLLRRRANRL